MQDKQSTVRQAASNARQDKQTVIEASKRIEPSLNTTISKRLKHALTAF